MEDVGIWVNEGLLAKLAILTGQAPPWRTLYVILGTNVPFTPDAAWVLADVTQPTWAGYAPQPVAGWLAPTTDPATNVSTCQGLNVVFNNTSGSPQSPTGFAIVSGPDPTDTLLVPGAFTPPPSILDGGVYVFTPLLSDQTV